MQVRSRIAAAAILALACACAATEEKANEQPSERIGAPVVENERAGSRATAQFVASSRGSVYYWIGCSAWKQLSPANLRYFPDADAAESAGYTPSKSRGCAPQLQSEKITATVGGNASCIVETVADGDTFTCSTGDRVRLLLVDAPELSQGMVGDSARRVLNSLIPPGTSLRLEFDVELRDQYDRLLAYAYRGSLFINRELASRGAATTIVIPPNVRRLASIRAAVDSARRERRGLWGAGAFACPPEDHRAGRCPGKAGPQ